MYVIQFNVEKKFSQGNGGAPTPAPSFSTALCLDSLYTNKNATLQKLSLYGLIMNVHYQNYLSTAPDIRGHQLTKKFIIFHQK